MKIRKLGIAMLIIALLCSLWACGSSDNSSGGSSGGTDLTGTPAELLEAFLEELKEAGVQMPMLLPIMPVPAAESQYAVGLSEEDFTQYVADSAQSMAAIGTNAHQIVLLQGVDDNAAGEIKSLISSEGGYNSQKWICVFPDMTIVVESGPYVLLAAAHRDVVDALIEIFTQQAGNTGEVITFWNFVNE